MPLLPGTFGPAATGRVRMSEHTAWAHRTNLSPRRLSLTAVGCLAGPGS
jgi:hypothetical protein